MGSRFSENDSHSKHTQSVDAKPYHFYCTVPIDNFYAFRMSPMTSANTTRDFRLFFAQHEATTRIHEPTSLVTTIDYSRSACRHNLNLFSLRACLHRLPQGMSSLVPVVHHLSCMKRNRVLLSMQNSHTPRQHLPFSSQSLARSDKSLMSLGHVEEHSIFHFPVLQSTYREKSRVCRSLRT